MRKALRQMGEAELSQYAFDAFGYFGAAYGLEVIAPEGVSTESEASAQDVAKIIRQIKAALISELVLWPTTMN